MLANKQRCEIVKNNTTETVVKLETLAMISRYNQFFCFWIGKVKRSETWVCQGLLSTFKTVFAWSAQVSLLGNENSQQQHGLLFVQTIQKTGGLSNVNNFLSSNKISFHLMWSQHFLENNVWTWLERICSVWLVDARWLFRVRSKSVKSRMFSGGFRSTTSCYFRCNHQTASLSLFLISGRIAPPLIMTTAHRPTSPLPEGIFRLRVMTSGLVVAFVLCIEC